MKQLRPTKQQRRDRLLEQFYSLRSCYSSNIRAIRELAKRKWHGMNENGIQTFLHRQGINN